MVLAGLALLAGVFVTLLGVTGFAATHHNDFGSFARPLPPHPAPLIGHILHP